MGETNRPVCKKDVLQYFCDDSYAGCAELTNEFVNRITVFGTDNSISSELNYALRAWAIAEDGDDSGYASNFVRVILR